MNDFHGLMIPGLIVFVGYVVLGLTSFGSALIIVPLLSWKWPLSEVVPLTLMLDVPAAALLGGLNLRYFQRKEFYRLFPGVLLGSFTGLWLGGTIDPRWPLLVLGAYVATVGLKSLRPALVPETPVPAGWGHVAGFVIGLVELMFGTAGPVVVAWLQRRLPDLNQLRATIPLVIVLCASIVICSMAVGGQLSDRSLWIRWAAFIGVAIAGVVIGNRLARKVSVAVLRKAVCTLLVFSGLLLVRHVFASSTPSHHESSKPTPGRVAAMQR